MPWRARSIRTATASSCLRVCHREAGASTLRSRNSRRRAHAVGHVHRFRYHARLGVLVVVTDAECAAERRLDADSNALVLCTATVGWPSLSRWRWCGHGITLSEGLSRPHDRRSSERPHAILVRQVRERFVRHLQPARHLPRSLTNRRQRSSPATASCAVSAKGAWRRSTSPTT